MCSANQRRKNCLNNFIGPLKTKTNKVFILGLETIDYYETKVCFIILSCYYCEAKVKCNSCLLFNLICLHFWEKSE